jgi:hypothetical protein
MSCDGYEIIPPAAPLGGMVYQGVWDASTNTPTLSDASGVQGHFYEVSVGGSQDLGSGSITFSAGDQVVHNGSVWQKWDLTMNIHAIGGALHSASLLADVSALITDATLDGVGDIRPPESVIVYREGGVASGNVFTSFAAAHAAAVASASARIVIDSSLGSPVTGTGTFNMIGIPLVGTIGAGLTVQEGCTFIGLLEIRAFLSVVCDATTTPMDAVPTVVGFASQIKSNAGKAALIKATGTDTISITLRDGGKIRDGGAEVLDLQDTSALSLDLLGGSCELEPDTVTGAVGTNINVKHNSPGSTVSQTQSNHLGGFTINYPGDGASGVGVDDSGFGNPSANNLQEFADDVFPIPEFEATKYDITAGTPSVHAPAQQYWDPSTETIVTQQPNTEVNLNNGEEVWVPLAKNDTGFDIDNGDVVYVSGADGSGNPTIALAKADIAATADGTIGIATHNILDTELGRVTNFGVVRDMDTNAWAPGTILFLSPTVAGGLTSARPVAPDRTIVIGLVLVQNVSTGSILVNIEKESRVVSSKALYSSNPPGGSFDLLGFYELIVTSQSITSAAPYVATDEFYNAQACINVTSASGAPFTLRITGTSVDETAGTTTPADTEDIAVAANGDYASDKKWLTAPTFSIVEGSKSCVVEINRTRYWDNNNNNYRLLGSKWQFVPQSASWSFTYTILKINTNGTTTLIETRTVANTDSPPWGEPGKSSVLKRTDYNTDVDGSGKEGIIVQFSNVSMTYITADLRYVAI